MYVVHKRLNAYRLEVHVNNPQLVIEPFGFQFYKVWWDEPFVFQLVHHLLHLLFLPLKLWRNITGALFVEQLRVIVMARAGNTQMCWLRRGHSPRSSDNIVQDLVVDSVGLDITHGEIVGS